MRVLQVHWALPPTTGGVESHVADLSARLAARGCSVTVLTGEPDPDPLPGVRVLSSAALDLARIRADPPAPEDHRTQLVRELGPLLRELRPHVVHGHNLHHFAPGPALALDELSQRYGYALQHTFHETWPDLLQDTPVYRRWSGNWAVSAHVRDECRQRIGFEPALARLGVDTAAFAPGPPVLREDRDPVVLHPARLLPWKGVHVSVAMLRLLADEGRRVRLVVTDTARIADWDDELAAYRAEVLAGVEDQHLGDLVELRPVAYHDMPKLYAGADVVVYPTVAAEPYGLVPLEAMSCRRPVVASRCGGIPETVVHGTTGWLVDPGDPVALADHVARLLDDPAGARAMGEAGRCHVLEHFDLDRYVDGVLDGYRVASMEK